MFKEFGAAGLTGGAAQVTRSGQLDALVALERIGSRRVYARDDRIYAEGERTDCWFRVVSGAVRTTRLLADGRRHVGQFFLGGDSFGFDDAAERSCSAEAVDDVIVMRFPRAATERLLDEHPALARRLCAMMMRDLAHAQARMLLLGRMTASERVAHFLLELAERRDARRLIEVPMSRTDMADYLGLTMETVCRVLSAFKRDGTISVPLPHGIELRNREALEALCDA